MNYSIIPFVVFVLAVDSTFSLKCYVCDKKESSYVQGECENPKPTECSEPEQNICVKLTKARRIESVYKCDTEESSYDCKDYPDNCIHCSKDLCNEPDKKTTQNSLKCYECLQDYTKPNTRSNPETTYFYDYCAVGNDPYSGTKTRCYPNEQCVTASSDLDLRRYQGCVKDPKHFCTQYGFDHCKFCDKDLCNKFKQVHLNRCYRCISGDHESTVERFKNLPSCESPFKINYCGRGLKCASASYAGEDFERLYRDCGPISNKTDEFCEKYNYDECELCNEDLCNIPTKKKVTKCYYCIYGNMDYTAGRFKSLHKVLGNCSYPKIEDCEWTSSCSIITRKKKGELVGAMHVCSVNKETHSMYCGNDGIDCQTCHGNLCNKVVVNYTAMQILSERSSAEVLKNNTIFLLILLFIFIIIRADL